MSVPQVIESVIVHNGVAIIVGIPGEYDWLKEDDPAQHNCDAMGCASIGPHVIARIKVTPLRNRDGSPVASAGDCVK